MGDILNTLVSYRHAYVYHVAWAFGNSIGNSNDKWNVTGKSFLFVVSFDLFKYVY